MYPTPSTTPYPLSTPLPYNDVITTQVSRSSQMSPMTPMSHASHVSNISHISHNSEDSFTPDNPNNPQQNHHNDVYNTLFPALAQIQSSKLPKDAKACELFQNLTSYTSTSSPPLYHHDETMYTTTVPYSPTYSPTRPMNNYPLHSNPSYLFNPSSTSSESFASYVIAPDVLTGHAASILSAMPVSSTIPPLPYDGNKKRKLEVTPESKTHVYPLPRISEEEQDFEISASEAIDFFGEGIDMTSMMSPCSRTSRELENLSMECEKCVLICTCNENTFTEESSVFSCNQDLDNLL